MADPLAEGRLQAFPPCGAVAGLIARTDAQRGVWKAPAGNDASLVGAQALVVKLTDAEHGRLNPLGVNCLRVFPVIGLVVFGARTLDGADSRASEWKYLPVRRLALFIEESLYRGTQWAVFEPNGAPLWAELRLAIGGFLHTLFRQGAFQGRQPSDAYFVRCDDSTTTAADRDRGIVNVIVGFAPVKPAEFVIIKLQQISQQALN
jgi:phage tail sheath protein FI